MELSSTAALEFLYRVTKTTLGQDDADLTARQLALLLHVYLMPPPHTVRGLAASLGMSKPAVSRALDRLGRSDLLRRRRDEADRRSVLVQRTVKGAVFLRDLGDRAAQRAADLPAAADRRPG